MGKILAVIFAVLVGMVLIGFAQAGIIVFVLNIVGIPALAALSFWQIYGLLIVLGVAISPLVATVSSN